MVGTSGFEGQIWDLDAGAEPAHTWTAQSTQGIFSEVALAPDGRFVARGGLPSHYLWVHGFQADPPRNPVQHAAADAIAFHPTRDELYFIAAGRVRVASPPESCARELPFPPMECVATRVEAATVRGLAVCCGQTVRIYELNGTERAAISFPRTTVYRVPSDRDPVAAMPRVAFSPDGGQVAVGLGQALAVHHAVTGEQRFLDSALEAEVAGVAFDPGGTWLYVGRRDGSLIAHHTDTFAPERERGVPVEPRPHSGHGPVRRFAPDRVRRGRAHLADCEAAGGSVAVLDVFVQRLTDPCAVALLRCEATAHGVCLLLWVRRMIRSITRSAAG